MEILPERKERALQLKRLIAAEEANPHSSFSKSQLRELRDKLEYGACLPLLGNDARAQSEIPINKPEAGISVEAADFYNGIEDYLIKSQNSEDSIHGSIFMEYDATINQMLLWCYNWGIRPENPLYSGLAEAAQREVDRRNDALRGD